MTATRPFDRISLKWGMIDTPDLDLAGRFDLLAELGFDGVELDGPTDLPIADLLRESARSGVALPGVINARHWTHPLTDNDPAVRAAGHDGMVQAMELASDIGAEVVLLVPGVVTPEVSYATAWTRALEGIEALLPHAQRCGVKIGLENVWNSFLLSPLEAARLLDHFDDPRLGWYLDVGNLLRTGFPTDWIEVLGPRILRVDLKDYSLSRMNAQGPWAGFDVALGQGDVDWAAVTAALRATGYCGWASLEVTGGGRDRLAELRQQAEALRQF